MAPSGPGMTCRPPPSLQMAVSFMWSMHEGCGEQQVSPAVLQLPPGVPGTASVSAVRMVLCSGGKLVLSKLYEEGSNKRIFNIDRHVGMVTTHTPHTLPFGRGSTQSTQVIQAYLSEGTITIMWIAAG
ncbi:hypothetical protein INR49_007081, partial [Caranx melampygus]